MLSFFRPQAQNSSLWLLPSVGKIFLIKLLFAFLHEVFLLLTMFFVVEGYLLLSNIDSLGHYGT